jgi:predicted enzyme related to lactoylglutathione lyase
MSNHHIVHVDISAADREAAGEFYRDLFGWDIQHINELNYTTFSTGNSTGGGFNPVTDTNPAGTVLVYVSTEDIDATLAQVGELGGEVAVPKSEVPGFGWFAFFKDITGNMIGLWTDFPKE